jgi:hypothetical protein
LFESIITAALLLWAALSGPAATTPYHDEIVAAGMAVAHWESRWTPGAIGDNGCSIGYMQWNTCGGLGRGYDRAALLDGSTNARLWVEYVAVHLAAGYDMAAILQPWSVRDQALAMAEGMEGADALEWARRVSDD